MQLKLQHDDPHDAIAAQLRDLAPRLVPNSPDTAPVTQHAPVDQHAPVAEEAPAATPASTNELPLRATPLNDNAGDIGHPALRVRSGHRITRVLLLLCAVAAAVFAWRSYGEEAKQKLSEFAPQLLATVLGPTQTTATAEPQNATPQAPAPQAAASEAPAPQATAPQPAAEPPAAQDTATTTPATPIQPSTANATPAAAEPPPAQATIPPELASSIESMAREIETLKQTVNELKAGQQQLGRDIAKAAEHEAPRNVTTQTSKPVRQQRRQHVSTTVTAPHPRTPYLPPQTYSQGQSYTPSTVQREAAVPPPPPPVPAQLPPQTDDDGMRVLRPPMPVR